MNIVVFLIVIELISPAAFRSLDYKYPEGHVFPTYRPTVLATTLTAGAKASDPKTEKPSKDSISDETTPVAPPPSPEVDKNDGRLTYK